MELGGFSATGPRDANEDSYFSRSFMGDVSFSNGVYAFLMVSDGMGGYQGGDIASSLAVAAADRYLDNLLQIAEGNIVEFEPGLALSEIAQNAQEAIVAETESRGKANMGATFVGAFLSPNHVWIGHIGDSRAYLYHEGVVSQLTEDHSHVGRLLSSGVITEEEAQNHPDRNRIERALGFPDSTMDITEVSIEPGDGLLLCSDGVYTVLDVNQLAQIMQMASSAEDAAKRAVKAALDNQTDDNSTAVVALDASSQPTRRLRKQMPTMRMAPVSAASPRPEAESVDAGGAVRRDSRRQAPRRGLPTILIPILLFVVCVAVIVVVFLRANSSPGAARQDSGQGTNNQVVQSQPESGNAGMEGEGNPENSQPDGGTSTGNEQLGTYVVAGNAALRYVDSEGLAWRFNESQLGLAIDPTLKAGVRLEASQTTNNFGRESNTYRMLSDDYLEDLRGDLASFERGKTLFASRFSGLIDSNSYTDLLRALSDLDAATRENSIRHLAMSANDLVDDAAGVAVESTSQFSSNNEGDRTNTEVSAGNSAMGGERTTGTSESSSARAIPDVSGTDRPNTHDSIAWGQSTAGE